MISKGFIPPSGQFLSIHNPPPLTHFGMLLEGNIPPFEQSPPIHNPYPLALRYWSFRMFSKGFVPLSKQSPPSYNPPPLTHFGMFLKGNVPQGKCSSICIKYTY